MSANFRVNVMTGGREGRDEKRTWQRALRGKDRKVGLEEQWTGRKWDKELGKA
jgi:hypothetical protein